MRRLVLLFSLLLLALPLAAAARPAQAVAPLRPAPTPQDTESVPILHGAFTYPGYWWDHTQLTVAVQAHPQVDAESPAAVRQAIADWDYALRQEFGGLVTLTDLTGQLTAKHTADIVLHYNPTAGGTVFGGYAICGQHKCPNVIVRSDLPPSLGLPPYSPQYLDYVTMHELGHAPGLAHAQPLLTSTDLMGYGWNRTNMIVPRSLRVRPEWDRARVRVGAARCGPLPADASVRDLRLSRKATRGATTAAPRSSAARSRRGGRRADGRRRLAPWLPRARRTRRPGSR